MAVALVGELALWVALLLAAWGTVLSAIAGPLARRDLALSGERGAHASATFVALAALALWLSFLRTDLSLQYVALRGGLAATLLERTIAVWSAPGGALMVLAFAVALFASVALAVERRSLSAWGDEAGDRVAPAAAAAQLLLVGVLLTLVAAVPPFVRTSWAVADGQGLPPAWRQGSMLALWPLWAFGVAACGMAFALGIAACLHTSTALVGRSPPSATRAESSGVQRSDIDEAEAKPLASSLWRAAERWLGIAWLLVTAALAVALWWSYHTMQSLGDWASRGVDVTTALVWVVLSVAAFGGLRRLGASTSRLIVTVLPLLMLLASSLARGEGSWDPLHELAHGSGAAWWIVIIVALAQVAVYAVVRSRRTGAVAAMSPSGSAPGVVDRREPAVAQNAPEISTARDSSRALGIRLVAAGAALVVAGFIAGGWRVEHSLALAPGEPAMVGDVFSGERRVVFQGLSVRESRDSLGAPRSREVLYPIAVGSGDTETIVIAEVREYVDILGRPTVPPRTFPGIRTGVARDIVALVDSVGEGERAWVRLAFVPLTGLVWLGALVLLAGGVLVVAASRGPHR